MDDTKTRAELVTQALGELGAIASGQAPEPEDVETVNGRADGLFRELAARNVVSVDDEDEIPVEWCGPLAELLANEVAPTFGKPKKSESEKRLVEQRLRSMTAAKTTNEPLRTVYY